MKGRTEGQESSRVRQKIIHIVIARLIRANTALIDFKLVVSLLPRRGDRMPRFISPNGIPSRLSTDVVYTEEQSNKHKITARG